jgi:hypothetical protein
MSRNRFARPLAVALGAATLAAAAAAQTRDAAAQTSEVRYEEALARYEIGHYETAFALFAALADGGHCEAARIARQMSQHGKALYRLELRLDVERAQRWAHLPGCPAAVAVR